MARVTIPLSVGGGRPPRNVVLSWVGTAPANLEFSYQGGVVAVSEIEAGVGGAGTLRATVTDAGGTVVSADKAVQIKKTIDNSWLLMAGLKDPTQEFFARTRDAGVYSEPQLIIASDLDTSNDVFNIRGGQFLNIDGRWFLAGLETRDSPGSIIVRGIVAQTFDLVNWTSEKITGTGGKTHGIAYDGNRILTSNVAGYMARTDKLGTGLSPWSSATREASSLNKGVYSAYAGKFIFAGYRNHVYSGTDYNSLVEVDTPLDSGFTDAVISIAADDTGQYVAVGGANGQFGYSSDGGATWALSADAGWAFLAWLDMKHTSGSEFFACGGAVTGAAPAVARSSDYGQTWAIIDVTAHVPAGYTEPKLYACAYSDGTYFFGGEAKADPTTEHGLLMWTEDFVTFEAEIVEDIHTIGALAAGSPPVIQVPTFMAVGPLNQVNVYGADLNSLQFERDDRGAKFVDGPGSIAYGTVSLPADPQREGMENGLFASIGTGTKGIVYSVDGGVTWLSMEYPDSTAEHFYEVPSGLIYRNDVTGEYLLMQVSRTVNSGGTAGQSLVRFDIDKILLPHGDPGKTVEIYDLYDGSTLNGWSGAGEADGPFGFGGGNGYHLSYTTGNLVDAPTYQQPAGIGTNHLRQHALGGGVFLLQKYGTLVISNDSGATWSSLIALHDLAGGAAENNPQINVSALSDDGRLVVAGRLGNLFDRQYDPPVLISAPGQYGLEENWTRIALTAPFAGTRWYQVKDVAYSAEGGGMWVLVMSYLVDGENGDRGALIVANNDFSQQVAYDAGLGQYQTMGIAFARKT